MIRARFIRARAAALLLAAALPLAGCEDELLEFEDPDIIRDAGSASGAIALKNGVIQRFTTMTNGQQGPDALFVYSGLLADEFRSGDTFEQRNQADKRDIPPENTFLPGPLLNLHRVRTQGRQAIRALRQFAPTPGSNIGLMFALTGYAENLAGEIYCNGLTFSEVDDAGSETFGAPVTVDSAFRRAVSHADSALGFVDGAGGADVANLARIVRGRALLNLNQPAAAAAAVASVPTSFRYRVFHSTQTTTNQLWSLNAGAKRYVVADREGGNGMPFASANDPRIRTSGSGLAFDSQTPFMQLVVGSVAGLSTVGQFEALVVASGVEARLIEAEAALRAGDIGTWLAKLNEARATRNDLPPLSDPGSAAARVDLLFYERAFWMFGTGHRLGDLRRLVRQYARSADVVFPTGSFHKGGNYGGDVNLPITIDERNNPLVREAFPEEGRTCIDRNA